ncbi:MAG: class II fructose-bisphosphate aldolase, partial [Enterococcus sp.]|nr:class II fructose-bisphosphate aldolase [Enterococcus sp.]
NPKVIYLDEPTIGLDVVVKEKVRKAIKEINEKYGTTIILTTHDLNDIEELCSRIIIIDKGRKIYDGDLQVFKEKYCYLTIAEILVKEEVDLENFNIFKDIKDDDSNIEFKDEKLYITFNKNKLSSADVIGRVMKEFSVIDFVVKETGIDTLAVAIGTAHGLYPKDMTPKLNIDLLKELNERIDIPFVLHGGSGNPDSEVSEAVKYGVAKVNLSSDLKSVFFDALRDVLSQNPEMYEPGDVFPEANDKVREVVKHKLGVLNTIGKAELY